MGLVVATADAAEHEVELEAAPAASVQEVAGALARYLGMDPDAGLYLYRTDSWLEGSQPLSSSGLLHGDRLFAGTRSELAASPSAETAAQTSRWELVVVGGTNIGMRWPLAPGRVRVGRGRDCEISIDDPALSRTHLHLEVDTAGVWATDAGSTNGTFLNGVRLSDHHRWGPDEVIEAGGSLLALGSKSRPQTAVDLPSPAGRLLFNRPPRVAVAEAELVHDVPEAPGGTERPRLPFATAAVPLLIALVLWRLFPENPSLLVIMALSPVMVIFTYIEDRRRGSRGARRGQREWRDAFGTLVAEITAARSTYADRLRARAPAAAELQRRAAERTPDLWERRSDDQDFLLLRVGWGDRPWPVEIRHGSNSRGELRTEADQQLEPLRLLPSVPLTVELRSAGVVGLSGDLPSVEASARWLILQLATLHSPEDVSIVSIVDPASASGWEWTSWLPHVPQHQASPGDTLEELVSLLDMRLGAGSARDAVALTHPAIVVVVRHGTEVSRSSMTRLLREGRGGGIFIVWMATKRDQLPGETGAIVEFPGVDDVVVTLARTGDEQRGAREGVSEDMCRDTARALAPLIDASPQDRAQELPREVSLYSILDIDVPLPDAVIDRWGSRSSTVSVPIGVGAAGRIALDLSHDGPHALVAGTTGSGKSELLQTLVASLAWHYSPQRVNLLLIDYKGGAAFKDCAALPHTVGLVTDLDPHLSQRALVSLDAELKRRERILRAAGARDISELESNSDEGLPRLILIIDEFAALVRELPAFVDGVVDLAQRGRSLGIHLVLATQRPAGVINDAIRGNTNLRIALRVADEADSDDVVGTREAARIPRSIPGRAFLRRGLGEVEAFQSAFAGAPAAAPHDRILVRDRLAGRGRAAGSADAGGESQLAAAASALASAARIADVPAATSPWLPPLPSLLSLSSLATDDEHAVGAFGLIDLPELQRQDIAAFDPGRGGGVLIYGAGGSGKTTLLRTIAAALASDLSLDEVHIYAVDLGSGGLRALRALPHCGDVVAADEHERIERAFAQLQREVEKRKELFATRGATDLSELSDDDDGAALPRIVVMLDGYEAFTAAFERVNAGELVDLLPRLVSDGRPLGIHFLITSERRAGVPSALAALMTTKVILRMNDEDEYLSLGLDARTVKGVKLPPGRGYLDGASIHIAVVGPDPSAAGQRRALEDLGHELDEPRRQRPAPIALLPLSVPFGTITPARERGVAAFGVAEGDPPIATFDLNQGHLLVAGPYRSGRSTALAAIAKGLSASTPDAALWLLAPRSSAAVDHDVWTEVAEGLAGCEEALARLAQGQRSADIIVFIDDADELAEGSAAYALEPLVKGRGGSLRVVVAAEAVALHRSFGGWLSELRKHKQGLLLDPDLDLDGDLLGTKLPRRQKRAFPPGRGYQVTRGRVQLVQTAQP